MYDKLDKVRLYTRKVSREALMNALIVSLSLDEIIRLANNIMRLALVAQFK